MKPNNRDESFDLLAHEKKISELYQYNKEQQGEIPRGQVDSEIMAMAKQQLSKNTSLLTQDHKHSQAASANKNAPAKTLKAWQWPFSLVASVGILGILFITQRDYFVDPLNIIARDADIVHEPDMLTPNFIEAENLTEEIAADPAIKVKQMKASTQKPEMMLDENPLGKERTAEASKRMSFRQTSKVLHEPMLDYSTLEDNSLHMSPISLADLSKLAELLKLELTKQNMSEVEARASSVKMQQTLFENLVQYQKSHTEFTLTDQYLSVLTEKQVKQLKLAFTEAVPEN